MRWVERYKNEGNVNIHYRKPIAYKVKKEYVKFLVDEINKNKNNHIRRIKPKTQRTSCLSYNTEEVCENLYLKFKKDPKQKERKIHSILTYKMENNRNGCINRDKKWM
jgi:hypothetical protein